MINQIRDRILAVLGPNFTAEQLTMIDTAVMDALRGCRITAEETLPAVCPNENLAEVREYLARKKSAGCAPGTLEQYAYVLKEFCVYVQKKICDVRDFDVIRFLDDYESARQIHRRRKNGMRIILNGFFRYMADTGRIRINPMATVESIKYEKKLRQGLSDMELCQLRRACRTARDRALIEFLFATGCRISEVLALNREDVDFENRQVKVFGKGSKERMVFLSASAEFYLKEYLGSRTDRQAALFVSEKAPHGRIKKNAVEKVIRELGIAAGLTRGIFPHLLRHSCASYLLKHAMSLDQVQIYLGHENINTTRVYAKTDPEQLRSAYNRAMAA